VVKTPNGTASLDFNSADCRPGLILRRCRIDQDGNEVNVSKLGNDNVSPLVRGIDDSNGTFGMKNDAASTSAEGYKNEYSMRVDVAYVRDNTGSAGDIDYNLATPFAANSFVFSDAISADATSLRMITITTSRTDDVNNPVTVLRAYGANIGEIKPYRRTY
jgi:hypothetical protein